MFRLEEELKMKEALQHQNRSVRGDYMINMEKTSKDFSSNKGLQHIIHLDFIIFV